MTKYRTTTLDNYLIDASSLELHETMYVKCNRNISVADMQSARYISKRPSGWWDGTTEINSWEQPSGPD